VRSGVHRRDPPAVDLSKRLKLPNIADIAIGNMRTFHPIAQNNIDNLISEFYRFVHHMPATAAIFQGDDIDRHLKPAQKKHWDSLFSGRFDDDYIDQAIRIGTIRCRRKAAPYLYIAGDNACAGKKKSSRRPTGDGGNPRRAFRRHSSHWSKQGSARGCARSRRATRAPAGPAPCP